MVDVDRMTDAELRTKLMEFGFPIMPITGTTRKIMVKKLKLLMENKNEGRRSMGRYSSEEESEPEVKTTTKEKNRRATLGATPTQRSSNRARVPISSTDYVEVASRKDPVSTITPNTITSKRTVKNVPDEFDTGSDSEPEQNISTKYESPIVKKDKAPFSHNRLNFSPLSTSSPQEEIQHQNTEDALDRLNQIRNRLSLRTSAFDTYSSSPNYNHNKLDAPFLSNFTRRLSQKSPQTNYDYKREVIKENDTNGAGDYMRNFLGRPARYDRFAKHSYPDKEKKRNNIISLILVGVALLFFVILAVMYYGMRNDSAELERAGYFIPHCASMPDPRPGFNCVLDKDIENAIHLMHLIKPELIQRSIRYACNDPTIQPFMTETEAIKLAYGNTGRNLEIIQKELENLEVLAIKNANWGISLVKTDAGNDITEEQILQDMESLVSYRTTKVGGLAVLHPDLPLYCRIYNKIYAVFNTIIVLSAIFLTLYVTNYAYKYWKMYRNSTKDKVYEMVHRIIDVLEQAGEDYLVINHVRDMILPIQSRSQMGKVWDKAVKFINENESRVRTEVQVVHGEPYDVWRWLGNSNLSGNLRSKTWQGQAFETQVGSVNSLPCSPTPCLKIRGMIDDNDRNMHSIREAVLSKCAHHCLILHCAVDNTTKCVYLKCSDQNNAAIAYRNLHGWWYSGHLVTVKYLRLERYMQRFPDSPAEGPPFLKSLTPATDWSS
ncbi:hypothetical protein FQR65_LT10812 [Abscondita terminalis]|nr:hypothetical protein FQR65_LT10812 [Abscondita terminalis]